MSLVITRMSPTVKHKKEYLEITSDHSDIQWKDVYYYYATVFKEEEEELEHAQRIVNALTILLNDTELHIEPVNPLYRIVLKDSDYKFYTVLTKNYVQDLTKHYNYKIDYHGLRKNQAIDVDCQLYCLSKAKLLCDALHVLSDYNCEFEYEEMKGYSYK